MAEIAENDLMSDLNELEALAAEVGGDEDAGEDLDALVSAIETGASKRAKVEQFDEDGWPNLLSDKQKEAFKAAGFTPMTIQTCPPADLIAVSGIGPAAVRRLRGTDAEEAVKAAVQERKAKAAEQKAAKEAEKAKQLEGFQPLSKTCRKAEALGYTAGDVCYWLTGGEPKNLHPVFIPTSGIDCSRHMFGKRFYVRQEMFDNLKEILEEMKGRKEGEKKEAQKVSLEKRREEAEAHKKDMDQKKEIAEANAGSSELVDKLAEGVGSNE